jgi:molybdate transport system substrate-binding protein
MNINRRGWFRLLVGAVLGLGMTVSPASAQSKDPLVFAAASVKNALDELAAQWQRQTGKKVVISYAASNTLTKQIEQGAPADIFISADLDWMDYGQQKNLINGETRSNLLSNRIVLVAPRESTLTLNVTPRFDVAGALKGIPGSRKSAPRNDTAYDSNFEIALLVLIRPPSPT